MANTERLTVLRMVREAKSAVSSARFSTRLPQAAKTELERLYVTLDGVEDDLILHDLGDRVKALEGAGRKLEEVAARVKASIKELEAIADLVDKAAKAVKILVDIASKASTLGM